MTAQDSILKEVRAAFEREPRINPHAHPLRMDMEGDTLILDGEVGDIAAKKLALELGGAIPGVRGVVDRLHVAPAEHRGDGAIRDDLIRALLAEPDLRNCTVRACIKDQVDILREPAGDNCGSIEVRVEDGIVILDGEVISLSHKRLAGVLAWWTPGCRDVVNGLEVVPPEQDTDDEVTDALRIVLEKDPLVRDPEQIRIRTHDYVVTLEGVVNKEEDRHTAELDAWYLFGVDKVINRIDVAR
jgi:osmotically-inducible protein OsmY